MTRFTHIVRHHKRRVSRDTEEPAWPVLRTRPVPDCTELLDAIDEALGEL